MTDERSKKNEYFLEDLNHNLGDLKDNKNKLYNIEQHPHLKEILEIFKQEVTRIYRENLVYLILFGSQARREAKKDSDIDVLVVLKEKLNYEDPHQKTIALISELCLEYETLISCVYVSESQFDREKSPLLLNIHQEGIFL